MADAAHILVTADSQLLGGGAAYPVSVRDLGGGRGMLVLSDGREVGPITALTGPTGPPTTLAVGTVTKGETAQVTIRGDAPDLILDLVLPQGPAGKDSTVAGPASTVPGPPGKSAYQYAVEHGYQGTEAEYGIAATPSTVSWSQIAEPPATYAPSPHTHPVADVTGLQTALDGKVGTSDARLSDARTPKAHTHTQDDVNGLTDTLATKADKTALPTNTAWTATGFTFASGWSIHAANAGFWEPFVWRTRWGYVQLNGLVDRTGSNAAAGTVVGTLPASARPTRSFISGNLRFDADGTVTCNEAVVAGAYIALYGEAPIG